MPLSQRTRDAARMLVQRYPVARSALLPLLHLVQSEQGHVTDEGITFCAELLDLTKAEVGAVSSFYTMFKREPVGDWLLSVCTNPTCKIAGADEIYRRYREDLGGHHDDEAGVTVEHAECLGICDAAPVVQVNYEMYGPLSIEEADDLLAAVKDGAPPASNWSGDVPGTFAEVQWDLSGAGDGLDREWIRAARQQVDHDVPPMHRTGETDIPVTHPGGDSAGHGGARFREEGGAAPGRFAGAGAPGAMPEPPSGASPDEAEDGPGGESDADSEPESDAGTGPSPGRPAAVQPASGGVTGEQEPGGVPVTNVAQRPTGDLHADREGSVDDGEATSAADVDDGGDGGEEA